MMATPAANMQTELLQRRQRLENLVVSGGAGPQLEDLLHEVDRALQRFDAGTYGRCETCGDTIEADRLVADPLARFCLEHLSPSQARALEQDLDLAGRVQRTLLPPADLAAPGWDVAYHYEPLGPVSGDYCDAVTLEDAGGGLIFLLGDISGKGVAASMLMAHLHASVRTLVGLSLPLSQVVERANRVFCDSTMSNHYATLVCARFGRTGDVDICNAGHLPALLLRGTDVAPIGATTVPIGLFCVNEYPTRRLSLEPGDTLVLYTDGVTEARNASDEEYGQQRLARLVGTLHGKPAQAVVSACVTDLARFRGQVPASDDVTIAAIRRA